nr:flagella basal body P-ring formation protein FlgA [Ramlibacter paludis]
MLVWVDVWVDERFVRTVAVRFHVALVSPSVPGPISSSLVVQRGQWASLRSGSGAVSLEARVEVLQDGRLGDSIRVRQPGAAAGVIARVTGPGQLELAR